MMYKIIVIFEKIIFHLYSLIIKKEICKVGKHVSFKPSLLLKGGKYIVIGNNVSFGMNGVLTAWDKHQEEHYTPYIAVGNDCHFGDGFHISSINRIVIGNNVLCGRRISIIDNMHGKPNHEDINIAPAKRQLYSKGPIIIEDNVWIGDKVSIMSGVTIGYGTIIGANAVVTKSFPKYCIIGGVPAKIISKPNLQ
jgi:acetyltransferase-like isoleucine patch superfamily enzyme